MGSPTSIQSSLRGYKPAPTDEQSSPRQSEKRREARLTTNQQAQIRWQDDLGDPHEETVTIINVSLSGVGFLTRAAFRPGRTLTARTERESLEFIVRNSRPENGKRRIGAEILSRAPGDDRRCLQRLAAALRQGER